MYPTSEVNRAIIFGRVVGHDYDSGSWTRPLSLARATDAFAWLNEGMRTTVGCLPARFYHYAVRNSPALNLPDTWQRR